MNEPSTFNILPEEISISPAIIARLLHLPADDIPGPYNEIIADELSRLNDYRNIKGGYRFFDTLEIDHENHTFSLEGELFSAGKQVVINLKDSEKIALYACTAGPEISQRSHDLMKSGDLLEGYVCDIVGSLLVEEAMSLIHSRLIKELEEKGLSSTNRYCPGYCKWDVAEQHKLFSLLPEGFCGIKLSASALMNPIKSVSGVFGIGKKVKFQKYTCDACSNINCMYRNLKYGLER